MLNENVVKLLKSSMWDLATCAQGEPNVVPVAFKDVTPDGKLVVGDVFLDTTLKNIAANNGKIAISVYDAQNLEGYQVKGTARYVTEGEVVTTFKAMVEQMFGGAATAKGALVICLPVYSVFPSPISEFVSRDKRTTVSTNAPHSSNCVSTFCSMGNLYAIAFTKRFCVFCSSRGNNSTSEIRYFTRSRRSAAFILSYEVQNQSVFHFLF